MRRLINCAVCIITAMATASAGTALHVPAASASDVVHDAVVSADPVDYTPHVLNGRIHAITVVGDTVIVGGEFSDVQEEGATTSRRRVNIFAFDAHTGELDTAFVPRVDGPVLALTPGPSGTVFVGGAFTEVNGATQRGLTRLRVSDGRRVRSFGTAVRNGRVNTLASHGGRLYVGGRFAGLGGVDRKALARVDVKTGQVDPAFTMRVAEPRKATVSVVDMALSPDGNRLVIDGNFTRVAGKSRYQIALIDTSRRNPRLMNWATEAYTDPCMDVFHTYMRGVDFSADGSYFVVVTTGGQRLGQMCDTAARWDPAATGTDVQPDWVNFTGGDSLYAVAVTGAAIYVGGHQRWMDNPQGADSAGPGAVSRKGIAAIDPESGEALPWNPTRARGHGVEALVASPYGLFVGSDTERLGHEYHGRIGMFPVQGSAPPAGNAPGNAQREQADGGSPDDNAPDAEQDGQDASRLRDMWFWDAFGIEGGL